MGRRSLVSIFSGPLLFAAAVVLALTGGGHGLAPAPAGAVPANDNLANAIAIATPTRSGIVATGSNVGATTEGSENANPCELTGKTIWYTWTSPAAPGTVVFDTWGTDFVVGQDTVLAIYTGSGYPLSLVGCNDDVVSPSRPSAVTLSYAASTTYRIQVGSYADGPGGDVVLNMALGAAFYVNTTADTVADDNSLSLREAMRVATGAQTYASLGPTTQGFVRNGAEAGVSGSDLIHFLPVNFPSDSPATINIGSSLPSLTTASDVISGIGAGVVIDGTGAGPACVVVESNYNHIEGLRIQDCTLTALGVFGTGNSVGGALSVQRNVITTSENGIMVGTPYNQATATVIQGNYIGTDGVSDLGMTGFYPSSGYGILVVATGTVVGGSLPGEGNLISGSQVGLAVSGSTNTSVYGNRIGTDASGTGAIPNDVGVYVGTIPTTLVGPSTSTWVGLPLPAFGNIIAFNTTDGVAAIESNATIIGNSIHSNGDLGIDNSYPPVPVPPVVTSVAGGTVAGFTCAGCRVDVYNDIDYEGRTWLGYGTAGGSGSFSVTGIAHALPNITATSTDLTNSTSEFSTPFAAAPNQDGDGLADAADGCPFVAEDYDGFEDGDGCADDDNDMDGIFDWFDWGVYVWQLPVGSPVDCRTVAEDIDNFHDTDGCPEPDNDYDTFPDGTDDCPGADTNVGADGIADTGDEPVLYLTPYQAREDFDGVIDTDGCHDSPNDDYDGDGAGDETEVFTLLTNPVNPDTDADAVIDGSDNCPNWPNTPQNLPPWTVPANDSDCDGFTVAREQWTGTNPTKHCNLTAATNDEAADAWPSDFNDSRLTSLADVVLMGPVYNQATGTDPAKKRFDLNASGVVSLADVVLMGPFYNKSCA